MNEAAIFLIFVIGFYDLWLVGADKPTISRAYQAMFPAWADVLIMLPALAVVCLLPIWGTLKVALGAVAGHVFWANRERYHD